MKHPEFLLRGPENGRVGVAFYGESRMNFVNPNSLESPGGA